MTTHCHSAVGEDDVAEWEGLVLSLAANRARDFATGRRDRELYEDLAQEGRIAVFRFIHQHDPGQASLGTFLHLVIRRRMSNYLSKQRQLQSSRGYPRNGDGTGRRLLVESLDALERPEKMACLGERQSEREAETRAEILLAIRRAGLSSCEMQALRASLLGELTRAEKAALYSARRKMRVAIGLAETRRPCSDATKEKMRASNIGKKRSAETRERMSRGQMGRKCSPETREKLRLAALGHRHSEETKARIGRAASGRKPSPETRERLRVGALRRWENERTASAAVAGAAP